jgi:hypothetical protein
MQPYSQRVVAGTAASLSWQLIDGTGEPANPGTVTVTVTRADGTVIVTGGATGGATTAARTYALTAAQTATLDRLTAQWIVSSVVLATTEIDVVSAPWFSNAELRAAEISVASTSDFTAATITTARLQAEAFLERACNRRFVPGYDYITIPGNPSSKLILPGVDIRTIRSAALYDDPSSTATETLSATEIAAIPDSPSGVIERYSGTWDARWVKIGFEHGMIAPPLDMKRAAMLLCRHVLHKPTTHIPDNATSMQSDMGWSAILVTAGVRGAHTSLPTVNEAIAAWTFHRVGIA